MENKYNNFQLDKSEIYTMLFINYCTFIFIVKLIMLKAY